MAPFFTPKGVQAYAAWMLHDGALLVDRWQGLADAGTEVEVAQEMAFVTASIILKAMFSTERMESIHQMKDAVETMIAFVDTRMARRCRRTCCAMSRSPPFLPATRPPRAQ